MIVTFLTDPSFRRAPRGCIALCEPLRALVDRITYAVPIGFVTDGGSIPAFLWVLLGNPLSGSALRAFMLHDWMYGNACGLTRAQIDRILYAALRAEHAAWLRSRCIYRGVRWFGWRRFNKHRQTP